MQTYQNWRLDADKDGTLWLYFDKKNAKVNTLDKETMEELSTIIDSLSHDTESKGIIIASGKKNGFIAGADISQFSQFENVDDAVTMLKRGQHVFQKIAALKIPSVAMMEGFCVGGGLELALACHYRVAEEHTKLGLPEVKLGIYPGWGGSVRLPKLAGALQGLNLILSGHLVSGKVAAKIGFIDAAVPDRHLIQAANYYILHRPSIHKTSLLQKLSNTRFARKILAYFIRKKLRSRLNPLHYPSPFQVLDNWEQAGVKGQKPYDLEAQQCGRLFFSETSRNLVRVFFLQERLKGLAKESSFAPQRIHVVGAGTMGGDIAAWCAMRGMRVTLQDREPKLIAPAIKRAYILFKEKLKEPYLIQRAMDNLIPDVAGYGIHRADVIIEAIFEDLSAKQALFKALETQAKPDALLATNTSSIPLNEINAVMQKPERLVGIHFFNPVAKMQLVEVVQGDKTNASAVENALSFVRKIDRLPLPVKSTPGFLINRILMPYLLEAVKMLDENIHAADIDKAMVNFGMPMGPITLADTVGLDICLSVAKYLSQDKDASIPKRLINKVNEGKLGRKSGEGFYKYKKGKQIKPDEVASDIPLEEISERLVSCLVDESLACLREKVVADGDLLDAGMIFATGFAPFRGGPIHYAETRGMEEASPSQVKPVRVDGSPKTIVAEPEDRMQK